MNPPSMKHTTSIVKSAFTTKVTVGALLIPAIHCTQILKFPSLLKLPKQPSILSYDKSHRLVLLKIGQDYSSLNALPKDLLQFVTSIGGTLHEHVIELGYDHWSTNQILRSILPADLEIPSSFATIGHIAHFNLRSEYKSFKKIIGEVVIDKSRHIRTVVNKLDVIDHTFRYFDMELMAGVAEYVTTMVESKCRFTFDFSKVYWNSRLQGEHARLVHLFATGETIVDVFGGVGPFALPAGKKGCIVHCNDLNPESYKYLIGNIRDNKLRHCVAGYNLDARDFIRQSIEIINNRNTIAEFKLQASVLAKQRRNADKMIDTDKLDVTIETDSRQIEEDKINYPDHYIMNLPATALDYLSSFLGLFDSHKCEKMPMIHCYTFLKSSTPYQELIDKVCDIMSVNMKLEDVSVVKVRTVAPKKDMVCISFRLSPSFTLKRKLDQ